MLIIAAVIVIVFVYSYQAGLKRMGPLTINPGDVEYRIRGEVNRLLGLWMNISEPERKKYFVWWLVFWIRFAPYIKDTDFYRR